MKLSAGLRARRSGRERLRRVHDRCARRLRELGLDQARDIDEILLAAQELSGRAIELVPFELNSTTVHGMLVSTDAVDYVVFRPGTPRLHREHVILHELSHVICDHKGHTADAGQGLVRALGRTSYEDRQEAEAEMMASLLGERISRSGRLPGPTTDRLLERVLQSLAPDDRELGDR
jgi:hypothetical protein